MMLTLVLAAAAALPQPVETFDFRQTLDAIRVVETGGQPNEGVGCKGDNGNAYGPYQIWSVYHLDAAERDKSLNDYSLCLRSKSYSERVVRAYMSRYAPASISRLERGLGRLKDVEIIARIHNGGPRGARKQATLRYWHKVHREVTR